MLLEITYIYKIILVYFLVIIQVEASVFSYSNKTKRQTLEPWIQDSKALGIAPFEKIDVLNKEEILSKYGQILEKNTRNVIFNIKQSKSCLVRAASFLKMGTSGGLKDTRTIHSNQSFPKSKIHKEDDENTDEWFEFFHNNVSIVNYPGYIPISTCHSQEFGNGGLVLASQGSSEALSSGKEVNLEATMFSFTLSFAPRIAAQDNVFLQGTVSCIVPRGLVGQIFLKRDYIQATPTSKKVLWSKKLKKFLAEPNFRIHPNVHLLPHESSTEIVCATNDRVTLQCERSKLGVPDWDKPIMFE